MRTLLPPPPPSSPHYSPALAKLASRILCPNPLPSHTSNLPLYILNAAAFPDSRDTSYDDLVTYILARLPNDDSLIAGLQYEVLFFAKAEDELGKGKERKRKLPGWQWCVQTYQLLSRVLRKRLHRLWIVGAESWIRVLVEGILMMGGGKGRRKVVFVRDLRDLEGWGLRMEELWVPIGSWVAEKRRRRKRKNSEVEKEREAAGRRMGRRAFGVREALPKGEDGESVRLPRVLREATSFLLMEECLKMEGIFRVNAKAVLVEVLKDLYDRGQQFVVWKERDTALTFPYWRDGIGDVSLDEPQDKDGFDVHCAAGLIKMWYAELKEPIFPQSCYQALERFYGNDELPLELDQLVNMLSLDSQWTILSVTARRILRMHLLPLLSRVIQHQDWNHMSAYSLAVCFAPALLRGSDIKEDAKMMGNVRRLLEAMITNWEGQLASIFGSSSYGEFENDLRLPQVVADREDPFEDSNESASQLGMQISGITLVDQDASASDTQQEEDDEYDPPPLPPRPRTFSNLDGHRPPLPPRLRSSTIADIPNTEVKRKPAPEVHPLPRYSMVVPSSALPPATLEHIPFYNTVEEPFEEPEPFDLDPDLPGYEAMLESSNRTAIPRKPVPKTTSKSEA
ncbi:MAG: hypothetical protein Q9220_003972 [cf. Caloplaca sp. 1 TL-2023]